MYPTDHNSDIDYQLFRLIEYCEPKWTDISYKNT
jgi:hypothetical protein